MKTAPLTLSLALSLACAACSLRAAPAKPASTSELAAAGTAVSPAELSSVFKPSVAAYHDLQSLSLTTHLTCIQGATTKSTVSHFVLKRPRMVSAKLTIGPREWDFIANGSSAYSTAPNARTYTRARVMKPDDLANIWFRSGTGGTGVMPAMLFRKEGSNPEATGGPEGKRLPDIILDGVACDQFEWAVVEGRVRHHNTISIGKVDHLFRRLELVQTSPGEKSNITETYTDVKVNPALPASTFVFTPKPGARAVAAPR